MAMNLGGPAASPLVEFYWWSNGDMTAIKYASHQRGWSFSVYNPENLDRDLATAKGLDPNRSTDHG